MDYCDGCRSKDEGKKLHRQCSGIMEYAYKVLEESYPDIICPCADCLIKPMCRRSCNDFLELETILNKVYMNYEKEKI